MHLKVLFRTKNMDFIKGKNKEKDNDYIFASIQTLEKKVSYKSLTKMSLNI